jgi:Ras-related protein Rap-1A/Ras-related protein Rap-1B
VYDREITLELYDSYDFGYSSREDTIRKQKGFVLVFDLHDPNSLKQLYATVEEIYHAKNVEYGTVPMILVGNKADLEKTVEDQSIEKLMNQFHISCYIETSAKTGKNVQEMAQRIAKLLVERTIVPKEFCEKLSNGKPLIEKKCDIM